MSADQMNLINPPAETFDGPRVTGPVAPPAPSAPPPARTCRLCNCPMTFVRNIESEKSLPLDTRSRVYLVATTKQGRVAWDVREFLEAGGTLAVKHPDGRLEEFGGVEGMYVTHFATCPKASSFGSGK